MSIYLVMVGLVGLGIGIWLGMPGSYTQSSEDIGQMMDTGGGRRQKTKKRNLNPLAWLHRNTSSRGPSHDRRAGRKKPNFSLEAPDDDQAR